MSQNELYHFGRMGMKWYERHFQPYPKGYHGPGKFMGRSGSSRDSSTRAKTERKGSRINARAEKKLSRIDRKVVKRQDKATKQYQKAIKKSNSLLSTQKGIDKAMGKANKAQRKVNRMELKGRNYYKRKSKKLAKIGIDESPKVKEIGQKYINSINVTSKAMYVSAMTGGSVNKRR